MATASKTKKCYYDVIGVERDASDDEIKKAFRKLALQLHPDKNLDRAEEAKEEFQKLQQAYEVLSNPQERAWYDKHRDAVLREGFDGEDDDVIVDLFPYFTSSCYSGFNDEEKGFYTVYRELFEIITNEEIDAGCEEDIPSFGDSMSAYEDVVGPFYAFWEAYCTSKSFMWKDEYDSRRAGNRYVARMMERENKKVRSEAKKAWNQQVRALVDFVKRKDKRVQEWKSKQEVIRKEKEAAIQKKMHEEKKKKLAERKKTLEALKTQMEKEQQKINSHMKDMQDVYGDVNSDEDSEEDGLYCPACNKGFRTQKAFENHEKSKKHLAQLEKLREMMEEDDELVEEGEEEEEDDDEEQVEQEEEELIEPESSDVDEPVQDEVKNAAEDLENLTLEENSNVNGVQQSDSDNDDIPNFRTFGASSKKNKKGKKTKSKVPNQFVVSDEDDIPPTELPNPKEELPTNQLDSEDEDLPKTAKKKRRRAKKGEPSSATATATVKEAKPTSTENSVIKDEVSERKVSESETNDRVSAKCMVCNEKFSSKTKLFKHIKSTGHAAPLTAVQAQAKAAEATAKSNKKKKGRGKDRET